MRYVRSGAPNVRSGAGVPLLAGAQRSLLTAMSTRAFREWATSLAFRLQHPRHLARPTTLFPCLACAYFQSYSFPLEGEISHSHTHKNSSRPVRPEQGRPAPYNHTSTGLLFIPAIQSTQFGEHAFNCPPSFYPSPDLRWGNHTLHIWRPNIQSKKDPFS